MAALSQLSYSPRLLLSVECTPRAAEIAAPGVEGARRVRLYP